jgi:hypothetical protein
MINQIGKIIHFYILPFLIILDIASTYLAVYILKIGIEKNPLINFFTIKINFHFALLIWFCIFLLFYSAIGYLYFTNKKGLWLFAFLISTYLFLKWAVVLSNNIAILITYFYKHPLLIYRDFFNKFIT